MLHEELIVDLWQQMDTDRVGAAELEHIQHALHDQGISPSPAAVARTLADHEAQLVHPDVLNADVRWRAANLFTAEKLNLDSMPAAVSWMERLAARETERDQLRQPVLGLKRELELVAASARTSSKERPLAAEVAQWLTLWLQNPLIFNDWFVLRRNTAEFLRLFGS